VVEYGDRPDIVVMQGHAGKTNKQISNSYVIDGNYQVKKASQSLEQYIVLSEDNRTNFPRITPNSRNTIYFAGQGYGHGVGMSQSGAKGMAKAGFTYKEILEHYFTGVEVR
jgi:stage II sporulation protein D